MYFFKCFVNCKMPYKYRVGALLWCLSSLSTTVWHTSLWHLPLCWGATGYGQPQSTMFSLASFILIKFSMETSHLLGRQPGNWVDRHIYCLHNRDLVDILRIYGYLLGHVTIFFFSASLETNQASSSGGWGTFQLSQETGKGKEIPASFNHSVLVLFPGQPPHWREAEYSAANA